MERSDKLRVFENNKGFVMVDGKLQEVKWLQTQFMYEYKEGGFPYYSSVTTYQKPNGQIGSLNDYSHAFDSIVDYEKSIPAKMWQEDLYPDNAGGSVARDVCRGKGSCKPEYWEFDEFSKMPVRCELRYENFVYDYSNHSFNSYELPKDCKIYDTKDECLSYNSYKVVSSDGTESVREGINKLVMLDDDQRKLVEEYETVCQKMSESGIYLMGCDNELTAYNMRKIEDFAVDYNKTPDVENPEAYEKVDRFGDSFKVKSIVDFYGDDNYLFVRRK